MNRAFISIVIGLALLGDAPDLPAEPAQSTPTAAPEQTLAPAQVAQGQFDFGVQLMRDRKWAGAAQAFERAINARTNFPQAYYNWGISLVQLGKQGLTAPEQLQSFQAAAEKFSKAAAQKPDDKLTYASWSETLVLIGDLPVESRTRLACYQGAVEKCSKAAELAPDDWESYNQWAVILSTKLPDYAINDRARFQLYKEAAALFAKAAEHARFSGEISPVCNNWAGALVRAAHVSTDREVKHSLLREALEKFERAARAQPGAAATYTMWGDVLIDLGKVSRLRGDFRDAIEKLNTSLARVYAQLDDPVMAVQNLKKCFDADTSRAYRQSASQDADLATLRGTPEFEDLLGKPGPRGIPNYNPHLSDRPQ